MRSLVKCLEELLYTPSLVSGGGCALTQLAHHIYEQVLY